MDEKYNIIIDTDPGIDDAAALTAAMFSKEIDVKLITTVAGNVSVDKTTLNALKLVEFFNKDIPVAKGAEKPLSRPLVCAENVHGESGMDGYEFKMPLRKEGNMDAVEAMRNLLQNSYEKLTIVAIAALTNIAKLITKYPECKKKIDRIIIMGGSTTIGNITPLAEFNMYVDPEAAKIVFNEGIPIVMCGLNITNKATLDKKTIDEIKNSGKVGFMLYSLFQHYNSHDIDTALRMHDLCAVAYLVRPELFKTKDCHVDIETKGEFTSGCTVADIEDFLHKDKNVKVCLDIDVIKFRAWFTNLIKSNYNVD